MQIKKTGHVKWFDIGKGYGFAICDGGKTDVFFYKDLLQGFSQVKPGALIECLAEKAKKGWQATEILSLKSQSASDVIEAEPETEWLLATVKSFDNFAGFGFFDCPNPWGDAFFHKRDLRRCGIIAIERNQIFEVRLYRRSQGVAVAQMRPIQVSARTRPKDG